MFVSRLQEELLLLVVFSADDRHCDWGHCCFTSSQVKALFFFVAAVSHLRLTLFMSVCFVSVSACVSVSLYLSPKSLCCLTSSSCLFSDSMSDGRGAYHKRPASNSKTPRGPQDSTVLGLMQLNKSTEHALVTASPPGHVTVTLLVDAVSTDEVVSSPLVQTFADVVYRYTGSVFSKIIKSFSFLLFPLPSQEI